jgi:hypothetical protein
MRKNFHETYSHGKVEPPSERSTGLVFTVAILLVSAWWRHSPLVLWVGLPVAVALGVLSVLAPKVLKPLNLIWFRIGLVLHRVVNPIVMLSMFALIFVPAGMIMRIWHDPLRSRRARPGSTYWIERTGGAQDAGSMVNQF